MSDPLWKELDLERHARLLQRAAGVDLPVVLCDESGEVLWSNADGGGAGIGGLISAAAGARGGLPTANDGIQRLELDANRALVFAPVCARRSEIAAWLAAAVDPRDLRGGFEPLEQAAGDTAAAIATELRLNQEVTSLVAEVSGRYEELNLVYTLEDQARALDQGSLGAQALLDNLAEFLEVDLATFVSTDRTTPICSLRLSKPISNLDLVFTELRGGLFRFVSVSKKPLILNDRDDPKRGYLFINMPHRLLACPVILGGRVAAMLVLMRHADRPEFTNGDRNLATVIASQTAIVLRNQTLLGTLQKFSEQLAAALIEAVEAKDPYTRGHSERVQRLSTRLARAAGIDGADIEDISWGALLHDVGKIGIPDAILCKKGRLSEDEYTLIKIHPERSYEILRHIEHLGPKALDAARYHQEKFDGTGYPHGLTGKKIPVQARVIAVGDTYDAMTSSRAYRDAQSHEVALAEIVRVAGTQLDPEFVRVFEKLCEDDATWLTGSESPEDTPR